MGNEIFCGQGLDSPNQIESLQQIKFYAHAISVASGPGKRSGAQKTDHVILPDGQIRSGAAPAANYLWSCGGLLCWPEGGLLWRFSGELVCSLAWSQVGIRTDELSR